MQFHDFEITLKCYRAFSQSAPVTFRVSRGITFFLGANNVGKSALIRSFYELRNLITGQILRQARSDQRNLEIRGSLHGAGANFDRVAHRTTPSGPIEVTFDQAGAGWTIKIYAAQAPHSADCRAVVSAFGKPTDDFSVILESLFKESLFVGAFRSVTVDTNTHFYDISIGKRFVNEWDQWANGPAIDPRKQTSAFERELRLLYGFSELKIKVSASNDQLHLDTEDGDFAMSEMGDGLGHLLVVLGNAMIRRPKFIFIDEPEIGLHPKMQEIFVRALAAKAEMGVLATSHSVALARSVADSIFWISRDAEGRRKCLPYGGSHHEPLIQLASEMSYSQYAELGANHLLLVEGKTDLKVFRELLRKFDLEHHFLVLPLNGANLTKDAAATAQEIQELRRLNAKSISVIFDSERTNEAMDMAADLKPFAQMCAQLQIPYFATDRHSTENYVTQAVLDAVFPGQNFKALGPFEKFGANGQKWSKSQNWVLFQRMSSSDFQGTQLKKFITETLASLVNS